jgi:RNA polymerase sigma-70 factor (ECF subfamily)
VRDLLEQYVPRVYRFALRLCGDPHAAEDLTQETLLRAWRERGRLRDRTAASVWLFRIAVNVWRDALRRGKSRVARTELLPESCSEAVDRSDQTVADQDDVRRALAGLDALPERQRNVLFLHACEGLSITEIADVLKTNPGAVKSNLSLARKRMRELLPELFQELFPAASSGNDTEQKT